LGLLEVFLAILHACGMPTLAERLVPDALWHRVAPLLPPPPPRSHGGRRRTIPDRACFAAVVFMARTSTPWEFLPARELSCGSASTAYRRFTAWTRAGVFDRLTLVLLDELGEAGEAASDQRLPWEVPRPQPRLSPYRVRRGFPRLLCAVGSPAATPKPCGCSPGRPKGRPAGPAVRYPAIKKPAKKPRKKPPTTAAAA